MLTVREQREWRQRALEAHDLRGNEQLADWWLREGLENTSVDPKMAAAYALAYATLACVPKEEW